MSFRQKEDVYHKRRLHLLRLKKQMQGLQNEMEFVEILAQFWPLPNMLRKMERLEERLRDLNKQYQHFTQLQVG